MRKSLVYVGWSILLSWVVMFIAFLGQMATTAATHFESTPVNPLSMTLMAGLLGVSLTSIAVGYLTKEAG
jgi:FtsH-binding integral membrane protein